MGAFGEFATRLGAGGDANAVFETLFWAALEGEADCSGRQPAGEPQRHAQRLRQVVQSIPSGDYHVEFIARHFVPDEDSGTVHRTGHLRVDRDPAAGEIRDQRVPFEGQRMICGVTVGWVVVGRGDLSSARRTSSCGQETGDSSVPATTPGWVERRASQLTGCRTNALLAEAGWQKLRQTASPTSSLTSVVDVLSPNEFKALGTAARRCSSVVTVG
ncbi:MAG TPA: hypothetical protein VGK53_10865 [Propionicimonas sp.]